MSANPRSLDEILADVAGGKECARQELAERVYDQLHTMAHGLIRYEPSDLSLGATDLVHEAYLRLFSGTVPSLNQRYFFGAAARAMEQLLVEHARARRRHQLLGPRVPLDEVVERLETTHQVDIEALRKALKELEAFASREHEVVLLRIFAGWTIRQIAEHQNCSESTIEKDWAWARAWLRARLKGGRDDA